MVYRPPGDMVKGVVQTYVDAAPDNGKAIFVGEGHGGANGDDALFDYFESGYWVFSRSWRFNCHQRALDMKRGSSSNGEMKQRTRQIESCTPSFPVFPTERELSHRIAKRLSDCAISSNGLVICIAMIAIL
jgi:hypothetical protein